MRMHRAQPEARGDRTAGLGGQCYSSCERLALKNKGIQSFYALNPFVYLRKQLCF